ncbi:MAG: glycosyltransferase family 2 protein [Chthoniobacterales bacterium]
MNLPEITPMILCYNERDNIARCLEHLEWAKEVVVLDEGSTDGSHEICAQFPNVRIEHLERGLSLAEKCNRGLEKITSEWVLSLDSDYMVFPNFVEEIQTLQPTSEITAYRSPFKLAFFGHAFPNSLYPSRAVLYRKNTASYTQDGHAHRVQLKGNIETLSTPIIHDDRKSIERWFHSQSRYAREEADKLSAIPWSELALQDRLRRMIVPAPLLVFMWTFFVKGMMWQGRSGYYYVLMRIIAEIMLSLALLDKILRNEETNP